MIWINNLKLIILKLFNPFKLSWIANDPNLKQEANYRGVFKKAVCSFTQLFAVMWWSSVKVH